MPTAGPYQLTHRRGEGAMGEVWAGTSRSGQPVAVKWLRTVSADRAALDREVAVLARLDHPHVAAILDHGVTTADDDVPVERVGAPWLAMELLDEDLASRPPRTWAELRSALLGMAAGLAHAHARGVLHLDLKPANVMWAGPVPRLVDFGIAERLGRLDPGRIRGSPGFMAPEQFGGRPLDPRADVFGLGATAWALLTGFGPYEGPSLGSTREAAEAGVPHPLPHWVPRELGSLLRALVDPEPGRRAAFAADAGAALAALPWPDGELPSRVAPRPAPSAATVDWLDDGDAPTQDVLLEAPSAGRVPLAPLPADWRGPEPTLTPRHGAGLALLGLRTGPMVGREAERDQLWSLLRAVAETGRARVARVVGPPGSGVDRLVEWLVERVHETGAAWVAGPEDRVGQLAGRDRPTVWLGGSAVQLRLAEGPVPVLLILRRDEHASAAAEVIELGPLSLPDLRLLVANTLAHHDETVLAVAEGSLGLPGFAVELLEHWARSGALRLAQGRFELAVDAPPVPPTWAELRREAVGRAVAGGDDVRRALELVAAWPGPAPGPELAEALSRSGVVGDALARASATGLVTHDRGAWRLVSPDVAAALWRLPDADARRATALELVATTAGEPAVRGRAWRAKGDLERAAAELPAGGELAAVLEELGVGRDDPRLILARVLEAGHAFGQGNADRMEAVLATVPDPAPPPLTAGALAVRADLAAMRGDDVSWARFAQAALREGPSDARAHVAWGRWALERLEEPDVVERLVAFAATQRGQRRWVLLRLAGRAAATRGRPSEAVAWFDEVEREDPGNEHTASLRAMAGVGVSSPEESLRELREVARRFRDAGNVFGVLLMLEQQLDLLLELARRDEALALLAEAERIAAEFGIGRPLLPLLRLDADGVVPDVDTVRAALRDPASRSRVPSPRVLVVLALRTADAELQREALDQALAWDERERRPRAARWRALRAALPTPGARDLP